jgi:Hypothetical protein (DUF2513)
MKRDMDLVRALLLNIEDKHKGDEPIIIDDEDFPGVAADTVIGHFSILLDGGFVGGKVDGPGLMLCRGITWEGHEFLDATRTSAVWTQTKQTATAVGGWTVGILKDVAVAIVKKNLKDQFGLEI